MSERRRRRLDEDSRGGLPLFPLVVVVILAGLLMGGVLAHFFGGSKNVAQSSATAAAMLPSPGLSPAAIPTSTSKKVRPAPTPSATATSPATATPSAIPSATAKASPRVPAASKSRPAPIKPLVRATPLARTVPAQSSPTPATKNVTVAALPVHSPSASGDDRAALLVRAYLEALARGDRAGASSYLATGTPNETFMTADSRIESIRSSNVGPQQYRVTADVQTSSGEYYVTFTVEQNPSGLAITDHFSIKTQ